MEAGELIALKKLCLGAYPQAFAQCPSRQVGCKEEDRDTNPSFQLTIGKQFDIQVPQPQLQVLHIVIGVCCPWQSDCCHLGYHVDTAMETQTKLQRKKLWTQL